MDELRRRTAPSSCGELVNDGIFRDQDVYLDFDGKNFGRPPVLGKCIFPSAEVALGEEVLFEVNPCEEEQKCLEEDIPLDDSLLAQMDAAMDSFPNCSQAWEFQSSSAVLKDQVSFRNF